MIGKKLLGLITSAFLLFNVVGSNGVKNAKSLDVNAQNTESIALPHVNYTNGGPYDLAIANEDKIIEMLKREGKIPKNATAAQIQEIYLQYIKGVTEAQNKMTESTTKLDKTFQAANAQKVANYNSSLTTNKKVQQNSTSLREVQEQTWNGAVRKDRLLVLLVDFPDFKHNNINPATDGPVLYYNDFTHQHYQDMIFGDNGYVGPNGENLLSMKQFYEQQSGGSYTIEGAVLGWYTASHDAAYYGAHSSSGGNDANPRALIKEALTQAANDPSLQALGGFSYFDQENRYGLAGNDPRVPDGFVDHVLVIHAGVGEEAGGGSLGQDAIWSHSWSLGGAYKIPGTNYYAYNYTTEPEDGAAGVFAHEYGHDLGLPDEYDTVYSGPGEAIGYWSIMSSGSWGGRIAGAEPTGFSPYAKAFLQATMPNSNWQPNVETINYADLTTQGKSVILDQASSHGLNKNVVKINLPDKQLTYTTPFGQYAYYGGKGTDGKPWNKSMSAQIDLTGKTSAELNFKTWYDIEEGWDFAYIEVKEQGQPDTAWVALPGNITTTEHDPDADVVVANGITGSSNGEWVDGIFDISAYADKKIDLRVHYQCDSYSYGQGFYIDNILVKAADGQIMLTDNAENATSSFDLTGGFTKNDGKSQPYQNYYLVEWRNQQGVDTALAHVNRGGQMLSYDPGMVVWYVDTAYSDNWTGVHPGEGYLGIVDADQTPLIWNYTDGKKAIASNSYEMHDAAFSLRKSAPFYLDQVSLYGRTLSDNNQFMHPFFDDSRSYTTKETAFVGRNVPKLGVKIYVTGENKDRSSASILIKK